MEHDTGKITVSDLNGRWIRSFDSSEVTVTSGKAQIEGQSYTFKIVKNEIEFQEYTLKAFCKTRAKWVGPNGDIIMWIKDDDWTERIDQLCTLVDQLIVNQRDDNLNLGTLRSKAENQMKSLQLVGETTRLEHFELITNVQRALETTMTEQVQLINTLRRDLEQTRHEQANIMRVTQDAIQDIHEKLNKLAAVKSQPSSQQPNVTSSIQEIQQHVSKLEAKITDMPSATTTKQEEIIRSADTDDKSSLIIRHMRLLSTLKFKELDDECLIQDHIDTIEHQLQLVGLTTTGLVPDYLQTDLCNKFIESLKSNPVAAKAIKAIANETTCNWTLWTSEITRRIANKEKLRTIVDRRMENLQFTNIVRIDEYIDQALAVYNLIRKVYGYEETSRIRELVHKFVHKIPFETVRRDIIDRMALRGNEHPDWELCVPFTTSHADNFSAETGFGATNVCDIVREVCSLYRRAYVAAEKKNQNQGQTTRQSSNDKVNSVEQVSEAQQWVLDGTTTQNKDEVMKKLTEVGFNNVSFSVRKKDNKIFLYGRKDNVDEELTKRVDTWATGLRLRKYANKASKN